jgi:hypothetical protein
MLASRFNMRSPCLVVAMLYATTMAVTVNGADSTFAHYRGVTLGDSLEAVVARLKVAAVDVRVVQNRPTPIREITWRPAYQFGEGVRLPQDAMAEMVLTFHLNRLARIVVTYDRDRIRGMTNADLHEALSTAYGAAQLTARSTIPTAGSSTAPDAIGRWGDAETNVLLWREPFPDRVKLLIASIDADGTLQTALADAVQLEATDGPTRDVARRVVEAVTAQTQAHSTRRDNKATFKP